LKLKKKMQHFMYISRNFEKTGSLSDAFIFDIPGVRGELLDYDHVCIFTFEGRFYDGIVQNLY